MNKKLLTIISFLLILLIPFNVKSEYDFSYNNINESFYDDISYINTDTNYKVLIEDDTNLLDEEEKKKLLEEMKPLTQYGNIIFKSINDNPSYSTGSYAENYYHQNFNTESGTIFLIDMDNRYIYIFSDGKNYNAVTSYKAEIITDNIYEYASDGEYYECASKAYSQIYSLLRGEKIAEPMRYICNIIFSISISFLLVYLFIMNKSKIRKASYKQVMKNAKSSIVIGNITANQTGTHKVYNPPSSSGSSGGGSSGGGSSGGGGGHSF